MEAKKVLSLGTESRKVAMFVPIWVAATALLWFGKLTPDHWVSVTTWGYGVLAVGLTAEHFGKKP